MDTYLLQDDLIAECKKIIFYIEQFEEDLFYKNKNDLKTKLTKLKQKLEDTPLVEECLGLLDKLNDQEYNVSKLLLLIDDLISKIKQFQFYPQKEHFDLLILAPKDKEWEMLQLVFKEETQLPISTEFKIPAYQIDLNSSNSKNKNKKLKVLISTLKLEGNINSAVITFSLLTQFNFDFVILMGIAAGDEKAGVKINDLIIPDKVINYESQKLYPTGYTTSSDRTPTPTIKATQLINNYQRARGYYLQFLKTNYKELNPYEIKTERIQGKKNQRKANLKGERPISFTDFKARFKTEIYKSNAFLFSGEKLLKDKSLNKRSKNYSNVKAAEMEAAGFIYACYMNDKDWLIVRAISDYGDPNKSKFEGFQKIVAFTAALCVKDIILNFYDKPIIIE